MRRTAGGLAARGIGRGDRVLLRLGNSADFPILFFAANALGAVPVPTSAQLTTAELAPILADLAPSLICLGPGLDLPDQPGAPVLGPPEIAGLRAHDPLPFAGTGPDDPAYMVLTSGTGGRPKGVLHAQRAAWARRMMWDGWYGLTPDDRVLHAGAFNWTYTLGAGLTDPWAIGATALVYAGPPDRHVWPRLAAAHGATLFAAAPGVYRQMLGAAGLAEGFATLRHGLSAGEALPEPIRRAWTEATGKPIHEALGMSEISTYVSACPDPPGAARHRRLPAARPPRRRPRKTTAPTRCPAAPTAPRRLPPRPRPDARLLEPPRRNRRRLPRRMVRDRRPRPHGRGRRHHPPRPRRRPDERRRLPGQPAEVEAALLAHPGIADAAAVDLPVASGATIVTAFYVPRNSALPEAELAAHCADRLARYKCPRAFHAVAALPRSANGKLLRRQLREAQASTAGGTDR